ncbi:hypothetical protein DOTSEDRAFT_74654 [Dothistroma septosporum NZE10]|uniref:Uncharacterized protein n=1 Tax=Dothistroma septosporum (strain NZE10 / CBS 128990) TaxID=675120 RepID=N1PBV5_DOTSN|nr:hypothetical protein DOTSEDRAFT_74654 [Dothistroma septosporum NZE10]
MRLSQNNTYEGHTGFLAPSVGTEALLDGGRLPSTTGFDWADLLLNVSHPVGLRKLSSLEPCKLRAVWQYLPSTRKQRCAEGRAVTITWTCRSVPGY